MAKTARSARPDPAPKKASALDAAFRVLTEAGRSMTCVEMIEMMAAQGYWKSPGGKTPAATLHAAITREIKSQGKKARFTKPERGKFQATPQAPLQQQKPLQRAPAPAGTAGSGGGDQPDSPMPDDEAVRSVMTSIAAWQLRSKLPRTPFEVKFVPLADVTPTQSGEDYDNPSSRELARKTAGGKPSDRREDNYPIILDENGTILDGNHRHAAATFNNKRGIWAMVPKKGEAPD